MSKQELDERIRQEIEQRRLAEELRQLQSLVEFARVALLEAKVPLNLVLILDALAAVVAGTDLAVRVQIAVEQSFSDPRGLVPIGQYSIRIARSENAGPASYLVLVGPTPVTKR